MRRAIVGLLMATTLVTPALAQWQGQPPAERPADPHDRAEVRHDRHEVREDRREVNQDHREVAQDRREIGGDVRHGDDRQARHDRQDLRADRQDFRDDRHDLHGDWRDGHRGPPGGPGGPPSGPPHGPPPGGHYHGPPPGAGWNQGWRDDHRYDWRGWRAENRGSYHVPRYYAPRGYGYGYRRFEVGIRIAPLFYAQRYWISDPYAYRLPPAYGPYRWVRYYDDVLLIDLRSGQVVDAINGFFW